MQSLQKQELEMMRENKRLIDEKRSKLWIVPLEKNWMPVFKSRLK